ncbi:hypothetical protein NKI56_17175 [Mesorhizobium sp. M0622]|uniref:hypothetical protein n=1 Tax=unclassified Mesorhizobium TaxID=325217 RepID=UPI00333D00EF
MPDLATAVGVLIGVIVVVAILSALLLWLWNTTMPDVFGLKTISFWQALKLLLIAGILFGSSAAIDYTSDGRSPAASQSEE